MAGVVLAAIYWIIGQQFAGLFMGGATDGGASPLFILLAFTLWPLRGADQAPARIRALSHLNPPQRPALG